MVILKKTGFTIKKTKGRFDYDRKWDSIKEHWLHLYINNRVQVGFSQVKKVEAKDEWCAEAYMETDYSSLREKDFIKSIHDLTSFNFSQGLIENATKKPFHNKVINLKDRKWEWFKITKLFDVKGSKSNTKTSIQDYGVGKYPYVVTSSINNGIEGFYNHYTEKGNVLTIDSATVGSCFYQAKNFSASDHVEKLIPKFNMSGYLAMFLTCVLSKEQSRYGYGRKFSQKRIKNTRIKLPVTKNEQPDWEFMENYIKSLPYSSNLKNITL